MHWPVQPSYISAAVCFQVRNLLISEVDKYLSSATNLKFKGKEVHIQRSYGGPAVILNVTWDCVSLSIDLVPCVKAEDLSNR